MITGYSLGVGEAGVFDEEPYWDHTEAVVDYAGEMGVIYEIEMCRDSTRYLDAYNAGSGEHVWDAYIMRPVNPSTPIGSACPLNVAETPSVVDIALEPQDGDGYAAYSTTYLPALILPEGSSSLNSYASMAYEIIDLNGTVVMPVTSLWIGPSQVPCPLPYAFYSRDCGGHGDDSLSENGQTTSDVAACAELCDAHASCTSFERSPSDVRIPIRVSTTLNLWLMHALQSGAPVSAIVSRPSRWCVT